MFDLKVLNSAFDQLEEERGIPRDKILDAIETALAAAYKREYGKKNQIIRAKFDPKNGDLEFSQVKIVVDPNMIVEEKNDDKDDEESGNKVVITPIPEDEADPNLPKDEQVRREKWSDEKHILLADAKRMKKDAEAGDEMIFPLESKEDYGRIAAQTAKQVITQKIREAEKMSVLEEFGQRAGEIVTGTVQRIERGNVYIDLGRTTGVMPRDEQIFGEHYRPGDRIKVYILNVDESPRGIYVRLSRSHPDFVKKLFEIEVPEIASKVVEIKALSREAGNRTKISVYSHDDNIDAVGSCVGQRGVRVSTVISELGGEKIDVIEWSELPEMFISNALSPGKIMSIELDENTREASIQVSPDQLSLVIGRGGQNVRLAAKLTGWKLDIETPEGSKISDDADLKEIMSDTPKAKPNGKGGGKKEGGSEDVAEEVLA